MTYYKLLDDLRIVSVATSDDLRKYQAKHNVLLIAHENDAEYLYVNDWLYRDVWFKPVKTDSLDYTELTINAIAKEEYDILVNALSRGVTEEAVFEPEAVEEQVEEEPSLTVEFVRQAKISELSGACNQAITNGFDMVDDDGTVEHYSLTLQDQANMNTARTEILSGAEFVPYHADGEEMTEYTADKMLSVIESANNHRLFNMAYFSSARTWVNSLNTIKRISDISYGDEIPQKYQSSLLKKYLEKD